MAVGAGCRIYSRDAPDVLYYVDNPLVSFNSASGWRPGIPVCRPQSDIHLQNIT